MWSKKMGSAAGSEGGSEGQAPMIPVAVATRLEYEGRAWLQVAFDELSVLTSLAVLAMVMQYSVFFFLMFGSPGIRTFGVPYCSSLHFISDNLAADKGTASAMIISSVLSWVVLTAISCKNDPALNRGVTNFLALVGFSGAVCTMLFDNTSSRGDWHLVGAGMLAASYVLAQLNFSIKAYECGTVSDTAKFVALLFSVLSGCSLLLYAIMYWNDPCVSDAVIVEYSVYLLTSVNNLLVYIDFTAMHTNQKLLMCHLSGSTQVPNEL